jgi:hypothetical protein
MLSGMADGELSEECKEKLRAIDQGLANVAEFVFGAGPMVPPALAYRLIDSFNVIQRTDDPCAQVLRQIDQSAGAMSLVSRLQEASSSFPRFAPEDLLAHISRVREEIQFLLSQD